MTANHTLAVIPAMPGKSAHAVDEAVGLAPAQARMQVDPALTVTGAHE